MATPSLLRKYLQFRPFSDEEAWLLFKLAAFGEGIGWTLLIFGIICDQLPVSWHHIPVLITGQIHGMLFMLYVVAAVLVGPSLRWPLPRIIFAGLCSVPPYGSLVYEQISDYARSYRHMYTLRATVKSVTPV